MTPLTTSQPEIKVTAAHGATDDYVEFCTFLRQLTGIDLSQYKRPQMERRLRSFYATRGVQKLTDSFERLRTDPQHLEDLLDRITINVSQLWRNPEQWVIIEKQLLPELAASSPAGQIRAWSAGCSYGAEAYTLATLCQIACPGKRVTIQGTDIDKRMVERARLGLFSHEDARTAPPNQLKVGFDEVDGGWRAKLDVRKLTRFDAGDLLQMQLRPASFDLILCRNTVIYFSEPIRDELHARLAAAVRPGGYLVIGSTERVSTPTELGLTSQHPFIYRKN
jgi:chemotaxis protein methyltransferase CheR